MQIIPQATVLRVEDLAVTGQQTKNLHYKRLFRDMEWKFEFE